jgi:cytochrome P450
MFSALTLSWAWYLLAQNPAAEQRLHQELDSVLGQRPPRAGDLLNLVYTDRVVRETLRLYPPAWRVFRATQAPLQIGEYLLPAGSNIVLAQWVTQRDPRWFANPQAFEPDRWADDAAKKLPRFAYFPFGGGPRVCIGAGFAMMEATLLLAAVAQRYRIRLVSGEHVEPMASITLRPKSGVRVVLESRLRSGVTGAPSVAAAAP